MWEACVFIGILGLLLAFLQRKSLKEGIDPIKEPTKEPKYIKLDKNSICYEGTQIVRQEQCNEAINELKLSNTLPWVGNDETLPSGCSWKEGKLYWNGNDKNIGRPRPDLAPVCCKDKQSCAGFVIMKKELGEPIDKSKNKCSKINKDIHLKLHEGEVAKKIMKEIKKTYGEEEKEEVTAPLEGPREWKAGISKLNELDFLRNDSWKGSYVPRGAVAMWSGEVPPKGWVLCDGKNGTVNLRNRFVMGAGTERIGTKGGSTRISMEHLPQHDHESLGAGGQFNLGIVGSMEQSAGDWKIRRVRSWPTEERYRKTKEIGRNAEYYPPYYRLAFIMKV